MLDALLATIGTLGILASLAAKFARPTADRIARTPASPECEREAVAAFPAIRGERCRGRLGRRSAYAVRQEWTVKSIRATCGGPYRS